MCLHQALLSVNTVNNTVKSRIRTPEWSFKLRLRKGLSDRVSRGRGDNQPKNVHPDSVGISRPPIRREYLISLNWSGSLFRFFPYEMRSCMKPRGHIHPQKALPMMVAAMSNIVGGISDEMETLTPDSNVPAIRVGFNFHKRIAGDEGRVKP
jgi:hypothetical protein